MDIIAEWVSDDASQETYKEFFLFDGMIISKKTDEDSVYMYYDFQEPVRKLPLTESLRFSEAKGRFLDVTLDVQMKK